MIDDEDELRGRRVAIVLVICKEKNIIIAVVVVGVIVAVEVDILALEMRCFLKIIFKRIWDIFVGKHLQIHCKSQVIKRKLKTFNGCEGSSRRDKFILFCGVQMFSYESPKKLEKMECRAMKPFDGQLSL